MNLYRSFGNLMEAWVTEEGQCSGNNDEDSPSPSSDTGTTLRSDSVDSGVETASSDTSFPATPCSISTDNAEKDTFTPQREGEGLTPASTSQSPVFSSPVPSVTSSSSPRICPRGAPEGTTTLHQKVEQALQRTNSKNPEPLTVDEVLRRRPRASFLPKRHASELVRGQRPESCGLRRTVNQSMTVRQMSEMCRRPMSRSFDKQCAQTTSEDLGEEEGKGLSPGLSYLEHVCQMLEEIARQQINNRTLQMEMDAQRTHQDMEALNICRSDSKAAMEDVSSCQSAEQTSSEPQRKKDSPHRHFRQRSASDTTNATLHLRKLNTNCRGQHLSTDDLLEMAEEVNEKQESEKEETSKTVKHWNFRIGSLRIAPSKGQKTQSSEKNSAPRRLSQLFRRKRKTVPV